MNPRLPDFFIVGAAKAGTTSLYQNLKQHPEIFLPQIKEVNYFCSDIQVKNFRPDYAKSVTTDIDAWISGGMKHELFHGFLQNEMQYEKIFSGAGSAKAVGELSNTYLYSQIAAKNIHAQFPQAKIIMFLRNPAERAFSHYAMDFRNGLVKTDFITEFNADRNKTVRGWGSSHLYFELGNYYEQVKRFFDLFPANQIKVFLFDELVNDEDKVFKSICEFIGVNSAFEFDFSEEFNTGAVPKNKMLSALSKQNGLKRFLKNTLSGSFKKNLKKIFFKSATAMKLNDADRNFLIELYKTDVQKTAALIHRDLSAWLK